jgi:hypothetical protein
MVPMAELAVLRDHFPNVMIVGPEASTAGALAEMHAQLRQPIITVDAQKTADLPRMPPRGAVIIRGIGALNAADQRRLHEWIGRTSGDTQVIVTSPVPIFPCVERGTFLDLLYYRLNTVYLELAGSTV